MAWQEITCYNKARELYYAGLLWMHSPYDANAQHVVHPELSWTFAPDNTGWPSYMNQGYVFSVLLED